jgi:AcrR family transcriptional regulator
MTETSQQLATVERKPGRPRGDGTDQRERLLDAAIQSFSGRGIAATSLRALAADAGVTPAMLNYYFGSKQRLVDAAVTERLLPALDELRERVAARTNEDCVKLISTFVSAMHELIETHPWLPGLWVREVLTEGGQLRDVLTLRFADKLPRPLAERFRKAQADGEINAGLEPRLMFVSLIGLTILPFAAAPVWRRVFDAGDIGSEQILAHTLALLTNGVQP